MKKFLSMLLTLCLMAAFVPAVGAVDFTDNSKITYQEEVDTMVALNIINGKGDGSYFDPAGLVTRGEMAKMISVALNGGKDPALGTSGTPTYTDTAGHWAAGYIEYCTGLGIVNGVGNGRFDPSATVTGAQAAKMMLVATGYDAELEGFTGANWSLNVNVVANKPVSMTICLA